MSLLNLNLPTIGGTNANEDPKIRTALSDIQTVVNALDNANIASGADINGSKLDDATISAAKLASDSVETAKIVNDAVTNDKIGDDAVDTAQIADDAVENAQIADDAVDTAQIADGAVETAQINDGAVTTAKIADDAVTSAKLGLTTVQDFAHSQIVYQGTGVQTITNLSVSLTAGTWLILAQMNFEVSNGLLCKTYLSDGSGNISGDVFFEGEGRVDYSIPVVITALVTFTETKTVGVVIGSGAGGSVDILVPLSKSRLTAVKLG